ncbi:MAG: hypothetical protein Q4D04_06460 [Clostridia bacterium]|nr:hypothetical protein [Clostridia bacterium]
MSYIYARKLIEMASGPALYLYAAGFALTVALAASFSLEQKYLFSLFIPVYLSFATALSAREAFSRDRKYGVDVKLRTLSVETWRPVCSRTLAAVTLNAMLCGFIYMLSRLTWPEGYGLSYSAGVLCRSHFLLSMSMFFAYRFEKYGVLLSVVASFIIQIIPEFSPSIAPVAFGEGLFDMRTGLPLLALGTAFCVMAGFGGLRTRIAPVAVLLAFAILSALLPANYAIIDTTPQRVTDISDDALISFGNLPQDITVSQICASGESYPWAVGYMQKLAERHSRIDFRISGTDVLPEAELSGGDVLVESEEAIIVVRSDDIYSSSFNLEGALLTAIDEATGLSLTYGGVPRGRESAAETQDADAWPSIIASCAFTLAAYIANNRRRQLNAV